MTQSNNLIESTSPTDPPQWKALTSHLTKWFYKPDFEALEIVLSAVAAHNAVQGDPCWLFVQGPSGSGKTEIIVNALRDLAETHVLGSINERTFISYYRGELGGLLPKLAATNNSGIFVFKDFTTMLSLREDERTKIISQLREIYDGYWSRGTGVGEHNWEGKVTCIAACTPALEDYWVVKRDLGERFLTVRWPRVGSKELARTAGRQRGHETSIRKTTAALGKSFLDSTKMKSLPDIPEHLWDRLSALAEMVAVLRTKVSRNPNGKREILSKPVPEEPPRINKSLAALVSAHAGLWKRSPNEDDYRIAKRVALDSIPANRLMCFHYLAQNISLPTKIAELAHVPRATVTWTCEELAVLDVVDINGSDDDALSAPRTYILNDKFRDLLNDSKISF